MHSRALTTLVSLALLMAGCGGGSDGASGSAPAAAPAPTPTPTPTATVTAGCSLREREDWALAQIKEWYLFPDTLPASLDPSPYTTLDDYIDALTATARAQRKDRYFTYLTTISGETAYYNSGSNAGFGFRLTTGNGGTRLFVAEAFEGAPALTAGLDRGTEILAIGTSATSLRTIGEIAQQDGGDLTNALGPDTTGTTRYFQVSDAQGTRVVPVTKADFSLTPVSSRYGAQIISDGGERFGYVNLRTFITPADPALRQAFASFKAAGISKVIVDLRYNGGGLLNVAETLADLLGGNRAPSDVVDHVAFRPEKASNNTTTNFAPQPESIAPTKIAFIGTGGTASASELVINAFVPYLHANMALIGANTYGKPVGQIALDRAQCDDRLRLIALAIQNAAGTGDYYDGLATKVEATCQASDDYTHPLGNPSEASTRSALDFLEGKTCARITGDASAQSIASGRRMLLTPARPSTAQRDVPGLF